MVPQGLVQMERMERIQAEPSKIRRCIHTGLERASRNCASCQNVRKDGRKRRVTRGMLASYGTRYRN